MERTLSCSGDEIVVGPFRVVPLGQFIECDREPIKIGSREALDKASIMPNVPPLRTRS